MRHSTHANGRAHRAQPRRSPSGTSDCSPTELATRRSHAVGYCSPRQRRKSARRRAVANNYSSASESTSSNVPPAAKAAWRSSPSSHGRLVSFSSLVASRSTTRHDRHRDTIPTPSPDRRSDRCAGKEPVCPEIGSPLQIDLGPANYEPLVRLVRSQSVRLPRSLAGIGRREPLGTRSNPQGRTLEPSVLVQ